MQATHVVKKGGNLTLSLVIHWQPRAGHTGPGVGEAQRQQKNVDAPFGALWRKILDFYQIGARNTAWRKMAHLAQEWHH